MRRIQTSHIPHRSGWSDTRDKKLLTALVTALLLLANSHSKQAAAEAPVPRIGMPLIHHVRVNSSSAYQKFTKRFADALIARGWEPGKKIQLDYRSSGPSAAEMSATVRELVNQGANVIYAPAAPLLRASYATTKQVPIVALDYTTDPVAAGFAASYARPGGNVTGVFLDAPKISGKWIEILRMVIPRVALIDILWDPAVGTTHRDAITEICRKLGIKAVVHEAGEVSDIERVFSSARRRGKAMVVLPSPMLHDYSPVIADQALKHGVLAVSPFKTFVDAGGALAYGPDQTEMIDRSVDILIRIIEGARPGDLPIERPTRFDFFFNTKTFQTLKLRVPQTLALSATPVAP